MDKHKCDVDVDDDARQQIVITIRRLCYASKIIKQLFPNNMVKLLQIFCHVKVEVSAWHVENRLFFREIKSNNSLNIMTIAVLSIFFKSTSTSLFTGGTFY